jgi:hypothetical protein
VKLISFFIVGRHLEQLALFALPTNESDEMEDESAGDSDDQESDRNDGDVEIPIAEELPIDAVPEEVVDPSLTKGVPHSHPTVSEAEGKGTGSPLSSSAKHIPSQDLEHTLLPSHESGPMEGEELIPKEPPKNYQLSDNKIVPEVSSSESGHDSNLTEVPLLPPTLDWSNPTWDEVPAFDLTVGTVNAFLVHMFGNWNFFTRLAIDNIQFWIPRKLTLVRLPRQG